MAKPASREPYRDASLPIERRVADLLGRMTLDEKVGQLVQYDGRERWASPDDEIVRVGAGSVLCVVGERVRVLQERALGSRLGIPLLFGIDAIHGHSMQHGATMFPVQLGLACAWDATLAQRVARATAREMAGTGVPWTFSPVFCLPKDLRWGRVGESFGEDPLLIAELGAAMVRGYQGDSLADRESVAACAKHYLGYGDTLGGRDASEAVYSERHARAWFLPPFRAAVEAGVATVMTAYHAIDGTPCTASRRWLTEVLRDELGFAGMVVTDWDNVGRMLRETRVCATMGEAARRALTAGNDLIMTTPAYREAILAELAAGRVAGGDVDRAVGRVLALKFRLGLFEDARLPDAKRAAKVIGCAEHRALAREAAARAVVVLKNRRRLLPLDAARLGRVAVVGPLADDAVEQIGDWSLGAGQKQGERERHPRALTSTVRDAFVRRLGAERVLHAEGCALPPGVHGWWTEPHHGDDVGGGDDGRIARAVAAARAADLCVCVVGDALAQTSEGRSTATLELPGEQRRLVEALHAAGTPLVVVLLASKPLAEPRIVELADAFVVQFSPGMGGGDGLVDVLMGDAEPEGRLPISFPHHVGQQPVAYQHLPGTHQERYADLQPSWRRPLFAFGQGQGYSRVQYGALRLAAATLAPGAPLVVEVDIQNIGERRAVETVQWYLHDRQTSVTWPERRLVGWHQARLAPGERAVVRLELPHERLALCAADGAWRVEPGEFEIQVGPSSRDEDLLRAPFAVPAAE